MASDAGRRNIPHLQQGRGKLINGPKAAPKSSVTRMII